MLYSAALFVAAVLPFASAFSINTPSGWTSGGQETVTWSTSSGDPSTFSIELTFPSFNEAFALANNVDASAGTWPVALPELTNNTADYALQFVNITNINQVFASSTTFAVAPPASTTTSGTANSTATSGAANSTGSSGTTTSGGTSSTLTSPATSASKSGTSTSSASTTSTTSSAASRVRAGVSMDALTMLVSLAAIALASGVAV